MHSYFGCCLRSVCQKLWGFHNQSSDPSQSLMTRKKHISPFSPLLPRSWDNPLLSATTIGPFHPPPKWQIRSTESIKFAYSFPLHSCDFWMLQGWAGLMEQETNRNRSRENMHSNGIQGEEIKNPSPHTQKSMFLQGKKEPKKEIYLPVRYLLRSTSHHYKGKEVLGTCAHRQESTMVLNPPQDCVKAQQPPWVFLLLQWRNLNTKPAIPRENRGRLLTELRADTVGSKVLHAYTLQAGPITSYHRDALYLVLGTAWSRTEFPLD